MISDETFNGVCVVGNVVKTEAFDADLIKVLVVEVNAFLSSPLSLSVSLQVSIFPFVCVCFIVDVFPFVCSAVSPSCTQ